MLMSCPRCERHGGQGTIYKAKIIHLGIELKICDECEACWTKNQAIIIENLKELEPFLEAHGRKYQKGEIEDLGYVEEEL